ncbi:MAG: hypothetical protein IT337_15240 [Thermomicrobiales bacterium]|nr:hypothetical protein [Thermomicrobiales bacterium]
MIAGAAAFLLSPVGRIVGIGVLAAVVAGGIWKAGYNYASRACQAAALRADLAAARQDLDAARRAEAAARAAADDLEKQKEADDEARRRLEAEIAKRPEGARCGLSHDDAERLR